MKKSFSIFLLLFISTLSLLAQEPSSLEAKKDSLTVELNWQPFYEDALQQAKKEDKLVLLYFTGSDWCGPCKVLDEKLFHTEKFKSYSDRELVLLKVDIPRRQDLLSPDKMSENLYLQKRYKVKSFPTLLFVNHRGRVKSEKKGYILTEYYFPYIQSVVNEN